MADIVQIARTRIPQAPVRLTPVAAALGLSLGIGVVPAAHAATFTVTNLLDSGAGSFRQAVIDANAAAGADTIDFQVGLTGTVPLASQVTITDSVTITGPGAGTLTLQPAGTGRSLLINNTPTVTITGLTFQGNGTATVVGAAISKVNGTLTIQNSAFTGNVTTMVGGALYNGAGSLTIQSSTLTGNRADFGGAIASGGAGSITIDQSTLSGNQATSSGGAIALYEAGALTITNSTLSGNSALVGGALWFYGAAAATITNSTISGNTSGADGGAIYLYNQTLTIRNSTLTGNRATGAGGAVYLYNSTLNLISTIVANSVDNGGTRDIAIGETGTVNADHSLIDNILGFSFGTDVANIKNSNPMLGPLANNGGPTQTHALLAGSPAIDTGSNPGALAFDQRGIGFPRTLGAQTDIGAFEGQGAPPAVVPNVVPTLSQWGTMILSALMGLWAIVTGFGRRRRSS